MAEKKPIGDRERIQAWFDGWGGVVFGLLAISLIVAFVYVAVTG